MIKMKKSIFNDDNTFFKSNELNEGGSLIKSKKEAKIGKKFEKIKKLSRKKTEESEESEEKEKVGKEK